jgi:hypothetical protein
LGGGGAKVSCQTCLFFEKTKLGDECCWHDRLIDERPWVMLCSGHLWMEKPPHMYLPPEERVEWWRQHDKEAEAHEH